MSRLADRVRVPQALVIETARETVSRFREQWGAHRDHLPLTNIMSERLEAHLATVPLTKPTP